MITYSTQKSEILWQGLLNRSDAKVMTSAEERKLLVELFDCKKRILSASDRPAGPDGPQSDPMEDFQHRIRELADDVANSADRFANSLGEVARRYQEIRGQLAMANVRLVAHVAKRYQHRGIPPGDLIQDGFCALLVAIDRFDLINETRLATYAIWWIRQAIQRAVASGAYPVRLNPRQLYQLARARANATMAGPAGDRTTRAAGPSPSVSRTIEQVFAATRPVLSLDAPTRLGEYPAISSFSIPEDDGEPAVENGESSVNDLIKMLNPREQLVLRLRFGLCDESPRTLIQVSEVLGVSKERVRQIQDRALAKLRESSEFADVDSRSRRVPPPPSLSRRRG